MRPFSCGARSSLPVAALLASSICVAQTPVLQSEPTVVTVTGQAIPLSATSASVEILGPEEIENSHAVNAADLLRQVPFLYFSQAGGRGGLSTISLRGAKTNFTEVLFDGIPLNDISDVLGGDYDFSAMNTSEIDRIEVVRGPLSSLYGSDAVAGVINIIPRRGEGKPTFEITADGGNFATRDVSGSFSGSWKNFDYALGGSYLDIGPQVEKDPYRLGTISYNSHLTLGANKILHLLLRNQDSHTAGFPAGGGGPDYSILRDAQAVHAQETIAGLGFQHHVNRVWLYSLDFDVFNRIQNSNVPALLDSDPPSFRSEPPQIADTNFRRTRFDFSNTLQFTAKLSANLGAGWRREAGESAGALGPYPDFYHLSRDTGFGNAEIVFVSDRFSTTLGIRADKSSDYRAVFSPRAGAIYRLTERGPRLKATWGRGFKLPSFYALADEVIGNPLLKPEFSRSFDIGIDHRFFNGRLQPGLTYFRNQYTDLVDFDSTIFRLVNRSQTRTQGLELAVKIPVDSHLSFETDASYLSWKLADATQPLRNVPHWQANARVAWQITHRWQAQADSILVGRRYDYQIPVPDQLTVGGFSNVSLASSYEFSKALTGFLRIDNLLDSRFHEYIGFPNPGVYGRAGVRFRF